MIKIIRPRLHNPWKSVPAYFDCLDQRFHLILKASLQGLERKHLILQTRLKRLTRRTICYSKSILVHDTAIGLLINQFFFADKRSYATTNRGMANKQIAEQICVSENTVKYNTKIVYMIIHYNNLKYLLIINS